MCCQNWGTPWDKYITWEGWVIHTKLLIVHAEKKTCVKTPVQMIDLGDI